MDPITIGLAFTAAQSAVSYIKQAVALGKDINSLAGQFSKFFESSDAIHRERTKLKAKANILGKTDAELGHEALQIAMHSDALRQAERDLKDMILWQLGKPELWEHMIKERTRLFKERAEAEREEDKRQLAHKKKMADMIMTGMYFLAGSVVIAAFGMVGIGVYGQMEEKRIYEEKVTARNLIILRQNKERTDKEQKEREEYIRGSK
jgi:hypothetical protein